VAMFAITATRTGPRRTPITKQHGRTLANAVEAALQAKHRTAWLL
jgi:hypothetical protein